MIYILTTDLVLLIIQRNKLLLHVPIAVIFSVVALLKRNVIKLAKKMEPKRLNETMIDELDLKFWLPLISCCIVYFILGVITNLLIAFAYPNSSKTSTTLSNFFIKNLSIVDFFTCLLVVPQSLFLELGFITNLALCRVSLGVNYFLVAYSIGIVGCLAVERWFAIKKPHVLKKKLVIIISISLAILASIIGLTFSFFYEISPFERLDGRKFSNCNFRASLGGIVLGIILMLMFFVVLLIVIFCYISIYIVITKKISRRSKVQSTFEKNSVNTTCDQQTSTTRECQNPKENKNKTKISSNHESLKSQIRSASMLFGVTLIFFLTWTPFWLDTLRVINRNQILQYTFFINNCTNFFVYFIFQETFRKKINSFCKRRSY